MGFGRVIALVDMDCFYVQIEQRRNPELKGKPCAVVQYNAWKGGGIIAVGYEARHQGVTRNMRGEEAKRKCPDIQLVQVPVSRGKANLTHYRQAGAEVMEVLSKFSDCCERASIDEAYIDLTESVKKKMSTMTKEEIAKKSMCCSCVEGYPCAPSGEAADGDPKETAGYIQWLNALENEDTLMLAVGSLIVAEMRAAVLKGTTFTCSAGIAHNKMLAKLCCGLHKPNKQTILPSSSVPELFKTIKISKVRNLGGKFGTEICVSLGIQFMGELSKFSLNELKARFGDKGGEWVYYLSQGIDQEPVRPRQLAKSTGCGKNFPGKTKLARKKQVRHWVEQLAEEMHERLSHELELNKREAKHLTAHFYLEDGSSFSRSCPLKSMDGSQIASDILQLLLPFNTAANDKTDSWHPAIVSLHIGASKFTEPSSVVMPRINSFFTKTSKPVGQNEGKDEEMCSTTDDPYDKNLTQEIDSKNSGFDKNPSLTSKQSIKSYFAKASETLDVNCEQQVCVKTASSCNETRVREDVSKKAGFDKRKRSRNSGISAFFSSETSKDENSQFQPMIAVQDTPKEKEKILDASPNTGIAQYLGYKEPTEQFATSRTAKWFHPYEGCSIDQNILNSLPEEIQREIKNTCEFECRQETKGINQFAAVSQVIDSRRSCDENVQIDLRNLPAPEANLENNSKLNFQSSLNSAEMNAVNVPPNCWENEEIEDGKTECKKCGKFISVLEMPVHLDYHFAKELELSDYYQSTSSVCGQDSVKQPPKKKKKTSGNIVSFFSK